LDGLCGLLDPTRTAPLALGFVGRLLTHPHQSLAVSDR
jgi:hypothetical protein